MSRERKPSIYLNGAFATGDGEFDKLLKDYQKPKKKQNQQVAEKPAPVLKESAKGSSKGNATPKVKLPKGSKESKDSNNKVVIANTPQARLQEELEEKHIARGRDRKSRAAKPRKELPEGAVELPSLEAAIKRGVKESSTLLLDWASPKAKMIGYSCKVYWDGEDTWFYARILNYDSFYDRHYVSPITYT